MRSIHPHIDKALDEFQASIDEAYGVGGVDDAALLMFLSARLKLEVDASVSGSGMAELWDLNLTLGELLNYRKSGE